MEGIIRYNFIKNNSFLYFFASKRFQTGSKRTIEYLGNGKCRFIIDFDEKDILRAQTQTSINASKNNATAEIRAILDSMGCEIQFVNADEADKAKMDEIKANLKAASDRVKANEIATIAAAPMITPKQYEDLCRHNENTSEDAAKVKRHLMEKSLAISLPSLHSQNLKEIFDFWDDHGKDKLALREMMALPQKLAVAYAEKLLVTGIHSHFIIKWLLLTWVLEVLLLI